MMSRPRLVLALAALLALAGCLLVDRFGHAWDDAKPDNCLGKIAQSLYYAEFHRDPSNKNIDDLSRGWDVDGQHFLLLKEDEKDQGGRLYKFDVVPGRPAAIFNRYRLAPTMRATFEHDHPNAPVSLRHDTVTLADLDDAAARALLIEISKDARYWEVEDKILYNTMHNPACRYDAGFADPDPSDLIKTKPKKAKP